MSVTLTTIETKVRNLIGDTSKSMIPGDIFVYNTSKVFTLTESNVISVTTVLKNDNELDSGDWSYDSTTNKVTISASLSSGDTIEIRYTYYPNYSSTEIQNYIKAALVYISTANYNTFIVEDSTIYPEPTKAEQNLIALIASLIIDPDNKTYRLPDVSVVVPRDLPTIDKIRKTIAIFKNNKHGIFDVLGL